VLDGSSEAGKGEGRRGGRRQDEGSGAKSCRHSQLGHRSNVEAPLRGGVVVTCCR
jgi:hypothetical protein